MFLYNSSKLSPVVFNNFKISAGLCKILNNLINDKYMIKTSAFKPMHHIVNNVGDVKEDNIYKLSFFICNREVKRDPHIITKSSFYSWNNKNFIEDGKDSLIKVPFLYITIDHAKKIFETTPTLKFTMIFHSTKHDHFYYDGEPPNDAFKIIQMYANSANYRRYSSILWIDEQFSKAFSNHPKFEIFPDRMGHFKITWPDGTEVENV